MMRNPMTDWMVPPEQEPGEFEQRWNVAPDRRMPIAEMFARGGMPGMEQYGEADPAAVYGAYDKAKAAEERRARILASTMPGQTRAFADRPTPHDPASERDRAMMEFGRDMLVPQTPLDVGLMVAGGPVGGKLLRGGAAALGAVFEPDAAEATSKLGRLFDPAGRIAERQAAGFSKIKGGTPAEAMNWRLQHSDTPIEQRTAMPVDKALRVGDEIIPIVGDPTRKLQGGYLTEVGGVPLPKPVLQEGGFDFALGQTVDPRGVQDVWGNAPGAATAIDKLARSALERGNRPVVMSTTMAKTGGDFGSQTFDTARQLTDPKLFSPELLSRIDTNMTKNMFSKNDAIKDWPGLTSENLDEFIAKKGGNVRAKLMKVLDQASVIKEGGPDIGMVRVANTNPDLYNTPSGYMGYHIADVTPGTGPAAHSTFPVATHGSNVRGLGGSVPGELVLRDLDAGLRRLHEITGSPQYLNRMDYFAIKPPREAAIKKGLDPLPKTQVVDQQMIDSIAEYVRKHGLKSVPPAMLAALYGREQMGDLAASDGYDAR